MQTRLGESVSVTTGYHSGMGSKDAPGEGMSPNKLFYNLALVGAGRHGLAIMEALIPSRPEEQALRLVGVADIDPQAPGILYARRNAIPVFQDLAELMKVKGIDIVVNATGVAEVFAQLQALSPPQTSIFNCDRTIPWEDFWDSVSKSLRFTDEVGIIKIGIIGGGKACQDVLAQTSRSDSTRRRMQIIGVVDPDPEAPGVVTARNMGIPTYSDWRSILQETPDLILELTGNAEVRELLHQKKAAQTQIIDHVQSRLLWELFKKEDDRLRLRVESEIKLADQRNRFQRIFDHLPDPVLVLNEDYIVEEVNQTFLSQFQKEVGEVIGKPCYKIFHQFEAPCDQYGLVCPLPQVTQQCDTHSVIQRFPREDGCQLFHEITMSPLCPPEGRRRKRVIEVIKDVTAEKQLEEALHNSEERTRQLLKQAIADKKFLETILNGINDQMMVIDLDYRIVEVNRALLEMVGMRREEVVGKHCYEVSHHLHEPCSTPDHPCPLKDAVATGKAASTTHIHFTKDGREHYIHVVCHPICDENGKVFRVIDLSRDITKEVTNRIRMLHDDKMTSLGRLSASVVHEINNPLTGILNFIKLMQRLLSKGVPSEADLGNMRNYLEMVYNETSRVSKTVSNLLAFSRKAKPEFTVVALNDLIEETLALMEYQMRLQGVAIQRRFADHLLPVSADPGQLKQALLNLFLNAQDAMPQGGTLRIETKNFHNREVIIRVIDTGVGIPKESFSQIFEPFYTTKKTGGVGLGLSVVYGIIRDHKGLIKVDSIMGQGTTFTIRLPAIKPGGEIAAA